MGSRNIHKLVFRQRLSRLYTSRVLMGALDGMLNRAMHPILSNTDLGAYLGADLLIHKLRWPRRQIGISGDKQLDMDNAFSLMFATGENSASIWMALQTNRSVTVHFLTVAHALMAPLIEAETECARDYYDPYRRVMAKSRLLRLRMLFAATDRIVPALLDSLEWLKQGLKLRELVMERFYNHAASNAIGMARGSKLKIEDDDLFQNHNISIMTALGRFDNRKGVLAPFITNSFFESWRAPERAVLGQSYHVPPDVLRRAKERGIEINNFSHDIPEGMPEEAVATEHMVEVEGNSFLYRLAELSPDIKAYLSTLPVLYPMPDGERRRIEQLSQSYQRLRTAREQERKSSP